MRLTASFRLETKPKISRFRSRLLEDHPDNFCSIMYTQNSEFSETRERGKTRSDPRFTVKATIYILSQICKRTRKASC